MTDFMLAINKIKNFTKEDFLKYVLVLSTSKQYINWLIFLF